MTDREKQQLMLHCETAITFYEEFYELEQLKYDCISQQKLEELSEIVKKEEVFLLKSRGMEQERERILEDAGIKGFKLREILEQLDDPSYRDSLSTVYEQLSQLLLDVKEINLRCNTMAQLRLHQIDGLIKRLENEPEMQKMYTSQAQGASNRTSLVSKKV